MKKIVDFMNPMYLNRPEKIKDFNKKAVNYWCPTGMIPIMLNQEEDDM